jgi:hypothetical protein
MECTVTPRACVWAVNGPTEQFVLLLADSSTVASLKFAVFDF